MVQSDPDELVEDAQIDGLAQPSRFGSFLRGLLLGTLASGAVLLGLSLSHPLPRDLPGLGTVRVEGQQATKPQQVVIAEQGALQNAQPQADQETPASDTGNASTAPEGTAPQVQASGTEETSVESTQATAPTEPATAQSVDSGTTTGSTTGTQPTQTAGTATPNETQAQPETETQTAGQSDSSEATAPTQDDASDSQVAALAPSAALPSATSLPDVPDLDLSGPAIDINARAFEAPPNAPLLAIVLDDAGNGALEADALALMTMPLTLAIRPEGLESNALAQAARSAKHEVLVQLPFARSDAEQGAGILHAGLSASDRTDLTQRNLAQMPQAIGVVPPDGATLIKDAQAMQSVIQPLQEHGFAFIDLTAGSGSTVATLAKEAGLSYSETSRYVPTGATDQQVFNSLESAAFQARQRGSAIVQIAASRAALTAILRWGLEQDRRPVWFAPVSAVLKRQAAAQ